MMALLLALADVAKPGLAYQVTYSYNLDGVPSPDGKRLLFIRIIEGREQLFTMASGGGGERQITRDAADHEDPAWSPDGSQIAFVRIEGARKIVHVIGPDGSDSRPVTPASQHAIHPSWTPDGTRILYCTDDDLRPPAKNESQIYAVDVRSGVVSTLISGGVNTYPAMSPDGKRIVFRKIVGDMNSEVFVANADGTGPRNLTNNPAWEGWPAWSPDGQRIAFAGNRNSNYQIFVMDADGGNARLAANTEGRATAPRWTADGKTIYFTNCMSVDYGRHCEVMAVPAP
jgi:TolB protein